MDKVYCCKIPFISATEQHQAAIAAGKPERSIYVEGRGAETFEVCVAQFRAGGTLGLCGGLRVLGASRTIIVERTLFLKSKGITPYDLDTGERDEIKLLNAAIQKINGARALHDDPRHARRIGGKGGTAKGIKAQERRDAILHEEIVQRLWGCQKLTAKDVAAILHPTFSESTLRRKFGAKR